MELLYRTLYNIYRKNLNLMPDGFDMDEYLVHLDLNIQNLVDDMYSQFEIYRTFDRVFSDEALDDWSNFTYPGHFTEVIYDILGEYNLPPPLEDDEEESKERTYQALTYKLMWDYVQGRMNFINPNTKRNIILFLQAHLDQKDEFRRFFRVFDLDKNRVYNLPEDVTNLVMIPRIETL